MLVLLTSFSPRIRGTNTDACLVEIHDAQGNFVWYARSIVYLYENPRVVLYEFRPGSNPYDDPFPSVYPEPLYNGELRSDTIYPVTMHDGTAALVSFSFDGQRAEECVLGKIQQRSSAVGDGLPESCSYIHENYRLTAYGLQRCLENPNCFATSIEIESSVTPRDSSGGGSPRGTETPTAMVTASGIGCTGPLFVVPGGEEKMEVLDTCGPKCGNGVRDEGEECDNNYLNSDNRECTSDCKLNVCGDGKILNDYVDTDAPDSLGDKLYQNYEECDDGNNIDSDGCDSQCNKENLCDAEDEFTCSVAGGGARWCCPKVTEECMLTECGTNWGACKPKIVKTVQEGESNLNIQWLDPNAGFPTESN